MAEAAPGPGGEAAPPQDQDMEGLKERVEQQQTMLAHLKEMVQSNEQQLVSKEKQVEGYAEKLASIKSRSKVSKRGSKGGESKKSAKEEGQSEGEKIEDEESCVVGERDKKQTEKKRGKSEEKSRQGNLTLLRKKLEENRMKFEQRGKEISASKGIEEMVENLRMQLEERDHVIQTLQKNLETKPLPAVVPVQVVAAETGELPHESFSSEHGDPKELYAQIVYKDNKILELNNRIMELEVHVLDLQENLKEKDAVIDARTKAITLMSEDLSRKSKSTLDSLDDTREQMRLMQNNFVTLEARMKDEKEQLMKQVEERERKIRQMDEITKKMESVRFDLTTRIAELQEKVVHLQTINAELQKQADYVSKRRDHEGEGEGDRVQELLRALDDANKQMIKIKAQHKNKVKSLNKQIESLKKVSESSEELLRLQQRVAELEEDKGNLQLHLVDFDELKASEDIWKGRVREKEERIKQLNLDLDRHLHLLTVLEDEKLNLVEDLRKEERRVFELESEVSKLKSSVAELEKMKVTAEMKAVELEEQVDILTKEKADMQRENSSLSENLTELKLMLETLRQEKTEMQEEIMILQAQVRESTSGDNDSNRSEFQMVSSNNSDEEKWKRLSASEEALEEEKHVKDSSNVELSLKLLEAELDDARKLISEQKDVIHELNLKLESREEEIEMQQEVISKLEQLGQEVSMREGEENVERTNKISEILKDLNEMASDLEEWKKRCSEVEDRLQTLGTEKLNLEKRLEEVTDENSVLSTQLKLQKDVSDDLASQLHEQRNLIAEKDASIKDLQKLVEEREVFLREGEEETRETVRELQTVNEEMNQLEDVSSKTDKEIREKEKELMRLTADVEEATLALNTLQQRIDTFELSPPPLEQSDVNDVVIDQLRHDCHSLQDQLKQTKEESNRQILQLENKVQELTSVLDGKTQEVAEKEQETEKLKQKLKTLKEKASLNLKAKIVLIQNLEEKQKEYESAIQMKEEMISNLTAERENFLRDFELKNTQTEQERMAFAALSEKYIALETELRNRDSKIEELSALNQQLNGVNESLKISINAVQQESAMELKLVGEQCAVLQGKIAELEREISVLQIELRNKTEETSFLRDQLSSVNSTEEEIRKIEESKQHAEKRNQDLIAEIMKKEDELTEVSLKVEELSREMTDKNLELEACVIKYKNLEQLLVSKDMQMSALEDRISGIQNSYSALEAKSQEREAFIESLEQEIAKSQMREQHMEEGLSFLEERRRSLEAKFFALGQQLHESEHSKEAAEEHEGVLEQRLASLASSEDALRKRLETLTENNSELSQRISELSAENEELKRNLTVADNSIRNSQREIEQLSSCESAYNEALETIEKLRYSLKHSSAEIERNYREKAEQDKQYIENLELDMRNMSSQLETLETEKKALMEHCEKLNDSKFGLEEEIEILKDNIQASDARIKELETQSTELEAEMCKAVERKEREILELKNMIDSLQNDLLSKADTSNAQSQTTVAAKNVESQATVLGVNVELQATVTAANVESQTSVIPVQGISGSSEDVNHLKNELENLKILLNQKETEIKSYQSRLLQLQFGSSGDISLHVSTPEQTVQHNVRELEEALQLKENQLHELQSLLEAANSEMTQLQLQLGSSCQKIEEMSSAMCFLQEEVNHKDAQLQEQMEKISSMVNSSQLSQQLERIDTDFQSRMLALERDNEKLYQELLKERAKHIVSDVITQAAAHVEERKSGENITDVGKGFRWEESSRGPEDAVTRASASAKSPAPSYGSGEADSVSVGGIQSVLETSGLTQELAEKLGDLRAELDAVKEERRKALMHIEQLQYEIDRLRGVEKLFAELQVKYDCLISSNGASLQDLSKESSVETEEVVAGGSSEAVLHPAKESAPQIEELTAVDLGDSAWGTDVVDEGWGWGSDEARLEEEHMQKQQASLFTAEPVDEVHQLVRDLKLRIEELEAENSRIVEELKTSQIRSGKMLKKLKDLKLKNESLMRENTELALKKENEFGGLDLAIEEELKLQIDRLEKEVKECKGERDAVRAEKEALQKKVEFLTAANERLSEREFQGVDLEYWQNKNRELENQIESLQWKIGELVEEKAGASQNEESAEKFFNWDTVESNSDKPATVQELQEEIAALAADNEQLQSMLEEQRNLRVAAEAALRDLEQIASSKKASVLQEENDLREECMALRENYELACKELEQLRSNTGNDSLLAENTSLRENYDVLYRELNQLQASSNNDVIAAEYSAMRENYEAMYTEMEKLRSQVDISNTDRANYESLRMAHDQLIGEMSELQKVYCNLNDSFEALKAQYAAQLSESSEKLATTQKNYELKINTLMEEMEQLNQRCAQVTAECQDYKEKLSSAVIEKEQLQQTHSHAVAEELQNYEQRISVLMEEKALLKQNFDQIVSECQNYEQKTNALTDEKEQLNRKCAQVSAEYAAVVQELHYLREENERNQRNITELTSELTRCSSKNTQKPVHSLSSYFDEPSEAADIFGLPQQVPTSQSQDKETCTEQVLTSSVEVETHQDEREVEYLEKLQQCRMQIEELSAEVQLKIKEIEALRELLACEQQERANTEQAMTHRIGVLEAELSKTQQTSHNESEIREHLMAKEQELSLLKSQLTYSEDVLSKTQCRVEDLESLLLQKEEDIQNSNRNAENQENMIQQIMMAKEEELRNLQDQLAAKEKEHQEFAEATDKDIANLKQQISDLQRQLEELVFVKDQDIQNLKIQVTEIEEKLKETVLNKDRDIHRLQVELTENNTLVETLSQSLQAKEREVRELEDALEAREDEIREAVLQIRDKNREIQQLNVGGASGSSSTVSDSSSEINKAGSQAESESSQTSELDLALYMLHQRDVRCEELTLELMQLLEERDTLQLRLSTALKINEELRGKVNKGSSPSSPRKEPSAQLPASASTSSSSQQEDNVIAPIKPEPITEAQDFGEPKEDLQALANKLSQLHSVDYRRDVTLRDEREQRHSDQMRLLQQRGAGVLMESNYTLSRDVQSPSTVLLNWLWGRSTPKVMHI